MSMNLEIIKCRSEVWCPVTVLLVSVVRLVLADLHPGAEALRTEVEAGDGALDPDEAGLVDVVPAPGTQILLTELQ